MNEMDVLAYELIRERQRIDALVADRLEKKHNSRTTRQTKVLLRQHVSALRLRSHQIQADLANDVEWLMRLANLEQVEQGKGVQAEDDGHLQQMMAARNVLEESINRERYREAELDDVFA